jgi:hypothetical protein
MTPLAWAYAQHARPFKVPELARFALAACSLAVFMGQSERNNPEKWIVADRYFIAPGSIGDLLERGLPNDVRADFYDLVREPFLSVWFKDGGFDVGANFLLKEEHGSTILRFRDSPSPVWYDPLTSSDATQAAPVPTVDKLRLRASCMDSITRRVMAPLGARAVLLEPVPSP